METVAHRELRNDSAAILRRVEAGETLQVTNRGIPVARLVPLELTVLEQLLETGTARRALADVKTLSKIARVKTDVASHEIISDTRGRW